MKFLTVWDSCNEPFQWACSIRNLGAKKKIKIFFTSIYSFILLCPRCLITLRHTDRFPLYQKFHGTITVIGMQWVSSTGNRCIFLIAAGVLRSAINHSKSVKQRTLSLDRRWAAAQKGRLFLLLRIPRVVVEHPPFMTRYFA